METRSSLLDRIKNDRDHIAWSEFNQIYFPLLNRYAQLKGLSSQRAGAIVHRTRPSTYRTLPSHHHKPHRLPSLLTKEGLGASVRPAEAAPGTADRAPKTHDSDC